MTQCATQSNSLVLFPHQQSLLHLNNHLLSLEDLNMPTEHPSSSSSLLQDSKKILKKRSKYNRINDEIRTKLIEAVEVNGELLKTVT